MLWERSGQGSWRPFSFLSPKRPATAQHPALSQAPEVCAGEPGATLVSCISSQTWASKGSTFSFSKRRATLSEMPHLMGLFPLFIGHPSWECSFYLWQLIGTTVVSRCNNPCIKSDTGTSLKYYYTEFSSIRGKPVLNLTQGASLPKNRK